MCLYRVPGTALSTGFLQRTASLSLSFHFPEDQGRRECHYEQLGPRVPFPPWNTGISALLPTALWLLPREYWDKCSQSTQARRLEGGEGLRVRENALEVPDSCATVTFWEPNCTPSQSLKLGERTPAFPLVLKAGLCPAEKAL